MFDHTLLHTLQGNTWKTVRPLNYFFSKSFKAFRISSVLIMQLDCFLEKVTMYIHKIEVSLTC